MAEKMSTGLCNYLMATGGYKGAFSSMEIRIYGGTPPATADAAIGGATLLCTVKNGTAALTMDTSAVSGILAKNTTETWSGTNVATGTAAFYRVVNNADDGTASTTFIRVQGTISTGGADMNLGNTSLVSGSPFTLNVFTQGVVPS